MTEVQVLLGVPSDRFLFLLESAGGQDPRESTQQISHCQDLSAGAGEGTKPSTALVKTALPPWVLSESYLANEVRQACNFR